LDLFPREGKYGHAAMFTFIRSSQYNLPISAIVCNFDPKLNVEFDNVVTYFHEFGHLMHNMVSKVSISSLSGTACQRDFVETPSQMFEEWCYCEEPLKRLVMPEYVNLINDELVKKINKQNKQMQGIFNARQLTFGLLDQAIHSESIPSDTWIYNNNLVKELFDWETSPKTNILANWGHMFGYDSSYYGYLWSKVYAIDLFSFFKSDPMNKELGMRLREKILSKGGSLDGLDLLRNFMEREPNPDAYIQWLSE
jgi:Zn-dependent oligopeptidase